LGWGVDGGLPADGVNGSVAEPARSDASRCDTDQKINGEVYRAGHCRPRNRCPDGQL